MTELEKVEHSAAIDFSEFNFDAGPFESAVKEIVTNVIQEALTNTSAPSLHLPYYWGDSDGIGGSGVDDPLTLYVELPIGKSLDNGPRWKTTLRTAIFNEWGIATHGPPPKGSNAAEQLGLISKRLKEIADEIDNLYAE